MALTEQDKARARAHMGYVGVGSVSTFSLGIPAALQTQFMIEGAFDKVLPSAVDRFRTCLDNLDAIEAQVVEDTPNLAANKIDEIELNPDEFEKLIKRYRYWQGALGNLLGVIPNPYDQRPYLGAGWGGGSGGGSVANGPVVH